MLSQSWPGVSGAAQVSDVRNDVEGLVFRQGVLPHGDNTKPNAQLLNRGSSMTPSPKEFFAVIMRTVSDGAQFIYNDGPGGVVPAFETAPQAGSRLDLFWVKAYDTKYDGKSGVEFGISKGDATTTGSPTARRQDMPVGALELGTMLIPAGATTLVSAGVTWTDTYQFAALRGGTLFYRSAGAMNAAEAALYPLGTVGQVAGAMAQYRVRTSGWVLESDDALKVYNQPNKQANGIPASIPVAADARLYTKVFFVYDTTNGAGFLTAPFPEAFPNACDGIWATTYMGFDRNPVVNDSQLTAASAQLYFGTPNKVVGVIIMAVGH
jgi:hypothetical protein